MLSILDLLEDALDDPLVADATADDGPNMTNVMGALCTAIMHYTSYRLSL